MAVRCAQGVAQDRDGLRDRGARRVRVAERVEHHEVVRDAVVADGCDRVPGRAQSRGVGLALIAQHVGLADHHEGRREAGELLVAGAQRGRERLQAPLDVGLVGVPEPGHHLRGEEVALGELLVGAGVHGGVGDRVVHRLVHEAHVAALLRHERERGGHVAADRVAGDGDAVGVELVGGALADDPLGGRVPLLDCDGIARFRRAVVLDEDDSGAGADRELADESVVRVGVAEHPAAAVHVEDHRQRPDGVPGPDDPHAHVADVGGHGDPAVIHGQLVDRRGLQLVEHGACLGRAQFVQERRPGGRLDEPLRGRLEHHGLVCGDHGHVRTPLRGGSAAYLGLEECVDVAGEQFRVLVQEPVAGVGIDPQLGVGEVLGKQVAVLGVHHRVVVAIGDECRLGDAGETVEL